MQTIVYNDFAGGYFQLYRGGAAVVGDEIIGKDKHNRLTTCERDRKNYVVPFYLTPHRPTDDFDSTEDKKMMMEFLGIDYNYVLENRRNGKELKIPVSRNFKCVFTKNGEIVGIKEFAEVVANDIVEFLEPEWKRKSKLTPIEKERDVHLKLLLMIWECM